MDIAEGFRRFALRAEHAPGLQQPSAVFKEGAVEQAFGGSGGIRAIHQDNVIALVLSLSGPGDAIAHRELEPRIRPGGSADVGKVFPAEFHHTPVNLHHVQPLDAWVAQAFPRGAAVPASDHQNPLDRAGAAQGWVHQSLVVVAFLLFRCHPTAIQEQPPPVALTANHADPLERTGLLDQHLSLQSIADAAVFFVNPAAHGLRWASLQLRTRWGCSQTPDVVLLGLTNARCGG